MRVLAIDPGPTQSAWVVYEDRRAPLSIMPGAILITDLEHDPRAGDIIEFGITENMALRDMLTNMAFVPEFEGGEYFKGTDRLYIEMIAAMGMAVGKSVFETVLWTGRFIECYAGNFTLVYRKDVKMHLCGNMKAKDSNIRQAIMDRYGSTRQAAIGTSKNPGPLHNVSKDVWSAIAIAITGTET